MAQYRPFAISPTFKTGYPGTDTLGYIVIGVDDLDYFNNYADLNWVAGPDEDFGSPAGIIIAYHDTVPPLHNNSGNPLELYNIGFLRAVDETEFVALAQNFVSVVPPTAEQAKIELNLAGYWTSYNEPFWPFGTI